MMDPDIIASGLAMFLVFFGIGVMVGIIRWSGWYYGPRRVQRPGPQTWRLPSASTDERLKALEHYKQLASEKLDVVKTAIAMGYAEKELAALDQRLEKLIGADALEKVIRGDAPLASAELSERDLAAELRLLRDAQ